MTAGAILWLALLVVLLGLLVVLARRISVLIARTRDLERVQRSVESIDRRLAATSDPLVAHLDEVRRHSGDPHALAQDLGPALAILEELAAETAALRVPAVLAGQEAVMIHETERAVRAAELVVHGLDALLTSRGHRDLEAHTSLKRGALNLRHAREAFARAAAEVAALRPVDLAVRPGNRFRAPIRTAQTATTVPSALFEAGDRDPDGPSEPRM